MELLPCAAPPHPRSPAFQDLAAAFNQAPQFKNNNLVNSPQPRFCDLYKNTHLILYIYKADLIFASEKIIIIIITNNLHNTAFKTSVQTIRHSASLILTEARFKGMVQPKQGSVLFFLPNLINLHWTFPEHCLFSDATPKNYSCKQFTFQITGRLQKVWRSSKNR